MAFARFCFISCFFLWSQTLSALELKLAHVGEPGSIHDLGAQEFARRANERLQGIAHITVYPAAQLGSDMELLDKVKKGEIAFCLPSSVMTSVDDRFAIFDMPFMFHNRHHVKMSRDALMGPYLRPAAAIRGFHILGMWEVGYRQITNNIHPIEKPEDLAGMKIRVPKGVWRVKMFESYDAKVSSTNLNEVYSKLKSAELEGQETPAAIIKSLKLDEVQKYLTVSNHVYTPAFLLSSTVFFDTLPLHIRNILNATAAEVQDWILLRGEDDDKTLMIELSKVMQVNELDPIAFTMKSLAIYKEFGQKTPDGRDMLRKILELTPWNEARRP